MCGRCITVVFSLYRGSSFRKEFSFIGELRSLVSELTPVMALTATATTVTRHSIVKSRGIVSVCPDKCNIKYHVVNSTMPLMICFYNLSNVM